MACPHNVGWCKGPGEFGSKCLQCQNAASGKGLPQKPGIPNVGQMKPPELRKLPTPPQTPVANNDHTFQKPVLRSTQMPPNMQQNPQSPGGTFQIPQLNKTQMQPGVQQNPPPAPGTFQKPALRQAQLPPNLQQNPPAQGGTFQKPTLNKVNSGATATAPAAVPAWVPKLAVGPGQLMFRGDSRSHNVLTDEGFKPWVTLSLDEAREFIRISAGVGNFETASFYNKYIKGGLLDLSTGLLNTNRTPADLMEWRIRTGSGNRRVCLVSTDVKDTCGGYANGYIYKMHVPNLAPYAWDKAIPGMTRKPTSLWPTLLLNKPSLDDADIIAIKAPNVMNVNEVSFITPVPKNCILDVKYVG